MRRQGQARRVEDCAAFPCGEGLKFHHGADDSGGRRLERLVGGRPGFRGLVGIGSGGGTVLEAGQHLFGEEGEAVHYLFMRKAGDIVEQDEVVKSELFLIPLDLLRHGVRSSDEYQVVGSLEIEGVQQDVIFGELAIA